MLPSYAGNEHKDYLSKIILTFRTKAESVERAPQHPSELLLSGSPG
jgi:hypothetical protein